MGKDTLSMDIDLNQYPDLKEDISDIFGIKKSLVDLARELENDLIIWEKEPKNFKLSWKKDILGSDPADSPVVVDSSLENINVKNDSPSKYRVQKSDLKLNSPIKMDLDALSGDKNEPSPDRNRTNSAIDIETSLPSLLTFHGKQTSSPSSKAIPVTVNKRSPTIVCTSISH